MKEYDPENLPVILSLPETESEKQIKPVYMPITLDYLEW